jgi:hypothetical protein
MLDWRALLVLVALLLLALAVATDDRAVRLLLTLAALVPFALFFLLRGRSQGRLLASASTEDGLHTVDVLDGRVVMDVYLDLSIANRHPALAERVLSVDVALHRRLSPRLRAPKGRRLGSRSRKSARSRPSTAIESEPDSTVPGKPPYTVSCRSRWASVTGSARSFAAITSTSLG